MQQLRWRNDTLSQLKMAMRESAVAAFAKNAGQLHASRILGECGYGNAASCMLQQCCREARTTI
jgi:hypothetical protein